MIRRPALLSHAIFWVSVASACSVAALVWLGYRSVTSWKASAALVERQSTDVAIDLLYTTLTRDMRAVQSNVLPTLARAAELGPPAGVRHAVLSGFTRYPYPELFFVARVSSDVLFYARSERVPEWLEGRMFEHDFPVTIGRSSSVGPHVWHVLQQDVATSQNYSVFDLDARGRRYQVIGFITYEDAFREHPKSMVGFMVDLDWIRQHYVPAIVAEVSRTANLGRQVAFTVLDERDTVLSGVQLDRGMPTSQRSFPLLFMPPTAVARSAMPPSAGTWTAFAVASEQSTLVAAEAGSRQVLAVSIAATLMLIVAGAVTLRAVRARTQLMEMRSTFLSAVTHELKTPVAGIRALMDMVASERVDTIHTAKIYARLAGGEVRRLARLIDNLLAYARVTDVTEIYSREPVDLRAVVSECLQHFWPQLSEGNFQQHVEIPVELPLVHADRAAITLVLSNLVDNAIRYSSDVHDLTIRISMDEGNRRLLVDITDKGMGIDQKEVAELTKRFFRSSQARPGGAGLGLAIASRILEDHSGSLAIRSVKGVGTTVTVALPVA